MICIMVASKVFYQCTKCGAVHKVEQSKIEITDELYTLLWCPHCKEVNKQLWVGRDELEIKELHDVVLDSKYFSYDKTK